MDRGNAEQTLIISGIFGELEEARRRNCSVNVLTSTERSVNGPISRASGDDRNRSKTGYDRDEKAGPWTPDSLVTLAGHLTNPSTFPNRAIMNTKKHQVGPRLSAPELTMLDTLVAREGSERNTVARNLLVRALQEEGSGSGFRQVVYLPALVERAVSELASKNKLSKEKVSAELVASMLNCLDMDTACRLLKGELEHKHIVECVQRIINNKTKPLIDGVEYEAEVGRGAS